MDEFLEDRIYDAAEEAGFSTTFRDDYVEFCAHSPLGEDISFDVCERGYTFNDIFYEVEENFKYFDEDEHAVMWFNLHGEHGAPTDLKALLKDARCIKILYRNLYLHMRDLKKELEEE